MTTTNEKEINPSKTEVELNPMITVDGFKLKKLSVITTFSDTTKIDKAILKFRKEALSVVPDLKTKKGRDAIASLAFAISKKKTNIVGQMVDPSIEEAKTLVKNVNGGKKYFQSEMDILRDEVRKPLNEWEAAEKIKEEARIKAINEKISGIHAIATFDPSKPPGKEEISSLMEAVDSINCEQGFDEFTQDALQAKSRVKEVLTEKLNAIIQQGLKEAADEELRLKELEIEKQQIKQQAQGRVNKLMMIPVGFFGKSSDEIRKKITSLENYEVKESEFGELTEQAKASAINVVSQLSAMLQQQELVEKSQAEELERLAQIKLNDDELKRRENEKENIKEQPAQQASNVDAEEKPVEQRLAERFAEPEVKTVREFLADYCKSEGYGTEYESLIEALTEGNRVWNSDYMDEHRWYICNEVVNEVNGTFIKYTDYIITGDNGMADMGLKYDLSSAKIVQKKERTVIETYYE